jgi:predicted nuclease with TOPRIM domain
MKKERVDLREAQRLKKLKAQEERLEQLEKEKIALEDKLEKLRQSVRIIVENDWNRATQDTIAAQEHRRPSQKIDWYSTVGFSSDEIIRDKRMQMSIEFYRNGLLNSNYAKHVLSSIKVPLKRHDQLSSIKFE